MKNSPAPGNRGKFEGTVQSAICIFARGHEPIPRDRGPAPWPHFSVIFTTPVHSWSIFSFSICAIRLR